MKNFKWEFNLVQDQQVNAFCMPGGKIVVYEGILPVTRDEASLAIVLGHEIAHAVAKHSAEQLSKAQRAQTGLAIGGAVLSSVAGSELGQLGTQVASYGIQLSQLKYRATTRARPTTWDWCLLLWQDTTLLWLLLSGSVWLRVPPLPQPHGSVLTRAMQSVSRTFRDGCRRHSSITKVLRNSPLQ